MVTTTVDHDRSHASTRSVKNEPGFSVKAWLFGRREEPEPRPVAPDAQFRWMIGAVRGAVRAELQEVAKALAPPSAPPRPVQGDLAIYNIHPRALLRRLQHLAVDLDADPSLGTRDCFKALHEVLDEFSHAALDEDEAQGQYEKRVGRNAAVSMAQGAVVEDAARRGEPIGPDSAHGRQVIGDMVGRALHASDPRPTALQVALTPDVLERLDAGEPIEDVAPTQVMPTVEAVPASAGASPVHIPGDDLRPALPVEDEQDADPGASPPPARTALPRRPRVTVMPAPMTSGEHPEPIGLRNARPAYGEVGAGDWVFDDSGPGAGALRMVRDVAIVYDGQAQPAGARVYFAAGGDRRVAADRTVCALSAVEAQPLVEAREAVLDEMEASR